jgi:hypothetical protein
VLNRVAFSFFMTRELPTMQLASLQVGWLVLAGLLAQAATRGASLPAAPAWREEGAWRHAPLVPAGSGRAGFTLMSGEVTGIRWTNQLSLALYSLRQNLMNGGGVALGDFDGDGWCDIYLCGKEGPNALYRNLGNWRFENVTQRAGVACTNQLSSGAVFADLDGDGRLDLLVTSFTGPNACFRNLGGGRFTNVTEWAGLLSKGGCTSMALGDVDGDGDLDLYVCYFGIEAILRDGGVISTREVGGRTVVTGRYAKRLQIQGNRIVEFGEPDVLYRNDGQGRFTACDWPATFKDEQGRPMAAPMDFGLAVQIRDINDDGAPDIYVCNDFQTPDRVWLNEGRGTFRAAPRLALRNMSFASMGVDFSDLDGDGHWDFVTVEMLSREHARRLRQMSPMAPTDRIPGALEEREEFARNALYWNRGDGTYAEIGFYAGVAATDWSWTPIFLDVDLDGFDDLLVSNGYPHDVNDRDVHESLPADPALRPRGPQAMLRYPRLETPNAAFRNRGDLTFEDVSVAWGFDSTRISQGMALADLDNDGDLDVVINCLNDAPLLYRNDTPAPRVAVRLKGRPPNPQAIGARILLHGGARVQTKELLSGARYLSGDDPLQVFAAAAGGGSGLFTLEVRWPGGQRTVIPNVAPNRLYEIDQPRDEPSLPTADSSNRASVSLPPPCFADVSSRLNHRHHEPAFDDFAADPLLPRKLSQLGPAVAWGDLNADGHEDLVIGAGRGGSLGVFFGDGKGGFRPLTSGALTAPLADDSTGLLVWPGLPLAENADSKPGLQTGLLLAGVAHHETTATNAPGVLQYQFGPTEVRAATPLPFSGASPGPLAAADIDHDGDLDLFVGGRFVPGRYPEAADSTLFRNEHGAFVIDASHRAAFAQVGLVSGAVFTDLDDDGWADLVLACEWGPLRIFRNRQGQLQPWDPSLVWRPDHAAAADATGPARPARLSELRGWWLSVNAGDFDGDGRLDLIAGNWGLNSAQQLAPRGPWSLYFGPFSGEERLTLLEAYRHPGRQGAVPWRDLNALSKGWPALRQRFPTHQAFAEADVETVLGEHAAAAQKVEANWLASVALLNRGERFEVVPLPAPAQWTPVFGINVADFDGDGAEDAFVSQNFFAVRPEDNRLDAGRGLWLRGDGQGGFTPVEGHLSGLTIYGEQRGSAAADFDEDGRVDLVVTQNGAATKLYRNVGAQPGLRVRLVGQPPNPAAIGARMRLQTPSGLGPAREVRAGGGYWSQDSAVQVLAAPETAQAIWIRWPGGQETTSALPVGAKEIAVAPSGIVRLLR